MQIRGYDAGAKRARHDLARHILPMDAGPDGDYRQIDPLVTAMKFGNEPKATEEVVIPNEYQDSMEEWS